MERPNIDRAGVAAGSKIFVGELARAVGTLERSKQPDRTLRTITGGVAVFL